MRGRTHPLLISISTLYLDLKIDSAAPDLAIASTGSRFFVLNIDVCLLFLLLVLMRGLLLPLCQLVLLSLNFPSPLL